MNKRFWVAIFPVLALFLVVAAAYAQEPEQPTKPGVSPIDGSGWTIDSTGPALPFTTPLTIPLLLDVSPMWTLAGDSLDAEWCFCVQPGLNYTTTIEFEYSGGSPVCNVGVNYYCQKNHEGWSACGAVYMGDNPACNPVSVEVTVSNQGSAYRRCLKFSDTADIHMTDHATVAWYPEFDFTCPVSSPVWGAFPVGVSSVTEFSSRSECSSCQEDYSQISCTDCGVNRMNDGCFSCGTTGNTVLPAWTIGGTYCYGSGCRSIQSTGFGADPPDYDDQSWLIWNNQAAVEQTITTNGVAPRLCVSQTYDLYFETFIPYSSGKRELHVTAGDQELDIDGQEYCTWHTHVIHDVAVVDGEILVRFERDVLSSPTAFFIDNVTLVPAGCELAGDYCHAWPDRVCLNDGPGDWKSGDWTMAGWADITNNHLYLRDNTGMAQVYWLSGGDYITWDPGWYDVSISATTGGTPGQWLQVEWPEGSGRLKWFDLLSQEYQTITRTFQITSENPYAMVVTNVTPDDASIVVEDICITPSVFDRETMCENAGPGFAGGGWTTWGNAEFATVGGTDVLYLNDSSANARALFEDSDGDPIAWQTGDYTVAIELATDGVDDQRSLLVEWDGDQQLYSAENIDYTWFTRTFEINTEYQHPMTLIHWAADGAARVTIRSICIRRQGDTLWQRCWLPDWSFIPFLYTQPEVAGQTAIFSETTDALAALNFYTAEPDDWTLELTARAIWDTAPVTREMRVVLENSDNLIPAIESWTESLPATSTAMESHYFTFTTANTETLDLWLRGGMAGPYMANLEVCLYQGFLDDEGNPIIDPDDPHGHPNKPDPSPSAGGCTLCPPSRPTCGLLDLGCWLSFLELWLGCIWCVIVLYATMLINYIGGWAYWLYQIIIRAVWWTGHTAIGAVNWIGTWGNTLAGAVMDWASSASEGQSSWLNDFLVELGVAIITWARLTLAGLAGWLVDLVAYVYNLLVSWIWSWVSVWIEGLRAAAWFIEQLVGIVTWLVSTVRSTVAHALRLFAIALAFVANFKAALATAEQDLSISLPCGAPSGSWLWHLCRGLQLFDETVGSSLLGVLNVLAMGVLGLRLVLWTIRQAQGALKT